MYEQVGAEGWTHEERLERAALRECCVVWNKGNECVGGFWFRDGEVIMVRFHTPGRAGVSADAVYLYTLRLNKFAN